MDQAAMDRARQINGMKANDSTNQHPTASGDEKPKVFGGKLVQAEFQVLHWVVNAEEGVTREDILKPEFWSSVAQDLQPFNRVEVRADDGSWLSELVVLTSSRAWARMFETAHHDFTTVDVEQTQAVGLESPFYYAWKGASRGHCVLRRSDKEVMQDNLGSAADAQAWIKERIKAGV